MHVTMSVELKVYLFIWSHNFRFSMSPSLSPNSLYRQTTDCTEGGGLTREHCILFSLKLITFAANCCKIVFAVWISGRLSSSRTLLCSSNRCKSFGHDSFEIYLRVFDWNWNSSLDWISVSFIETSAPLSPQDVKAAFLCLLSVKIIFTCSSQTRYISGTACGFPFFEARLLRFV